MGTTSETLTPPPEGFEVEQAPNDSLPEGFQIEEAPSPSLTPATSASDLPAPRSKPMPFGAAVQDRFSPRFTEEDLRGMQEQDEPFKKPLVNFPLELLVDPEAWGGSSEGPHLRSSPVVGRFLKRVGAGLSSATSLESLLYTPYFMLPTPVAPALAGALGAEGVYGAVQEAKEGNTPEALADAALSLPMLLHGAVQLPRSIRALESTTESLTPKQLKEVNPDAVQIESPRAEVRGLPAQSGINEGKVPTEEGARGVPQRDVSQAETGRSEVPLEQDVFSDLGPDWELESNPLSPVGLGGAAYGEVGGGGTQLKNAAGELDRALHGFPEAYPGETQSMIPAWERAGETLANNPDAGRILAEDVKQNPERGLTGDESALLLRHKQTLENAKNDAAERSHSSDPKIKAEGMLDFQRYHNELLDLLDSLKFRGTQAGREMRWRQALAFDDFSLETMTRDTEASVGRKLNSEEQAEIQRLHDRIAELEKAASTAEKTSTESQRPKQMDEAVKETADKVETDAKQEKATGTVRDIPGEQAAVVEHLKDRFIENGDLVGGNTSIRKLMELLYRQGITERSALEQAVHDILTRQVDPTITLEETQDLMSGYGKYKPLSKDPVKAGLREIVGQIQKVRKLLDFWKGQAPSKTGFERPVPGPIQRQLTSVVNEAKKAFGTIPTDPAKALKSALDSINTRLRNRLMDLKQEVATRKKIVKERSPSPYNEETIRLRKEIDETKKLHDEIFPKEPLTDAQRLKIAEGSADRMVKELERQLKSGEIFPKGRKITSEQRSAKLDSARARIEELKTTRDYARDLLQPNPEPEAALLQGILSRLRNREAAWKERLASGDFAAKPKKVPITSPEVDSARAAAERAKAEFYEGMEKKRLENRKWPEIFADWVVNAHRLNVISGLKTLGKLATAGLLRPAMTAVDSLAGLGLNKLPFIRDIAKGAPREGLTTGKTFRNLGEGYVQGWKYAASQAEKIIKTGQTDAEVAAGKRNIYNIPFGRYLYNLHALMKSVAFGHAWKTGVLERTEWDRQNIKEPLDAVREKAINNQAVGDGISAKFGQDNVITSRLRMVLRSLETDKTHPTTGKIISKVIRFILPVTHIPMNWFIEGATYSNVGPGLPRAAVKTFGPLVRGAIEGRKGSPKEMLQSALSEFDSAIEKLTPDQKDSIMRHWKKGSIGAGLLLMGFYLRNSIGGSFQPGKKDKTHPEHGTIEIGGVTLPRALVHLPTLEPLQFGATIGHVEDSVSKANGKGTIADGVMAATAGLLDEVPYTSGARQTLEAMRGGNARGELVKSAVVPKMISEIAEWSDPQDRRKAKTILEHIQSGIPILREQLPVSPSR